jgi:hypothetical protein
VSDFSSLFGHLPGMQPDMRGETAERIKTVKLMLSLHKALKERESFVVLLLTMLVDLKVVVELGYSADKDPRQREVDGYTVHYNNNLPNIVLGAMYKDVMQSFDGKLPDFSEFFGYMQVQEGNLKARPDNAMATKGQSVINKVMPLYCNILDYHEDPSTGSNDGLESLLRGMLE